MKTIKTLLFAFGILLVSYGNHVEEELYIAVGDYEDDEHPFVEKIKVLNIFFKINK